MNNKKQKVSSNFPENSPRRGREWEALSHLFLKPLPVAATYFKCSQSNLKKRCRALGIQRWPYRKLHSLHLQLIFLLQEREKADRHSTLHEEEKQNSIIQNMINYVDQVTQPHLSDGERERLGDHFLSETLQIVNQKKSSSNLSASSSSSSSSIFSSSSSSYSSPSSSSSSNLSTPSNETQSPPALGNRIDSEYEVEDREKSEDNLSMMSIDPQPFQSVSDHQHYSSSNEPVRNGYEDAHNNDNNTTTSKKKKNHSKETSALEKVSISNLLNDS
eukprot:gb/GECH01003672.1/.p1 GENE.gb/GECH01003672.1/~~gb/GECH01003672.1/.p1  ORF type:complete len:274 (+),score=93.20 gb/GECH01003672.1/:1-822(+)